MDRVKRVRKALYRYPMRAAIRGTVRWEAAGELSAGYTVVVGCMRSLWPVALATAEMLVASDRRHCREILLVFDCTEERVPAEVRAWVAERGASAGVRVLAYTARQAAVASRINWGWVYAWMSWSKGIAASGTRYVILHDLDAMLTGKGLLDRIYEGASAGGHRFFGTRLYSGNGVTRDMGIATTFELAIDVGYVRERFKPIDGFNRTGLYGGTYVDFDTFLWMQHVTGRTEVLSYEERELVHPTQLICNYTDLVAGRDALDGRDHGLVVLEYLKHLGGHGRLGEFVALLRDAGATHVPMGATRFRIDHISPAYWAWTEKQIRLVEQSKFGRTREEVEGLLEGVVMRAGGARTVGREPLDAGGVEAF